MAIFGQKCARCGVRTKHRYESVATCQNCEGVLKAKLQADAEVQRKCPIDGGLMEKEVAHMIVIDRCPKCHGVWLDGGELEHIKGGIEMRTLSAMVNGITYPVG